MKQAIIAILLFFLFVFLFNSIKQNSGPEFNNFDEILVEDKDTTSNEPVELIELTKEEKKYVGVYEIMVDGVGGEKYILNPDRTSVWTYTGLNDKTGIWSVSNGEIHISSNGNSGVIEEVYKKQDGVYRDDLTGDRILKRIK